MSNVKGNLVNFQYSTDNGVTYKSIVCADNSSFELTLDITKKRTNCGIKTAIGIPDFKASGTAVQNATPGASEASYSEIKALILAQTKVHFKYISAADTSESLLEGDGVNNFGLGYFTQVKINASADSSNGLVSFDWSFEGDGTLDSFSES